MAEQTAPDLVGAHVIIGAGPVSGRVVDRARRRAHYRGGTPRRSLLGLGLLAAGGLGYGWRAAADSPVAGGRVAAGGPGTVAAVPTSAVPTPDVVADQRRRAALAARQVRGYAAGLPGQFSFAVVERGTGAGFRTGDELQFQTASIVKVEILTALLLDRDGTPLSAAQRDRVEAMITASDNAAASELFAAIGGVPGLNRVNTALGLTQTRPRSAWGTTVTTSADQVRLLRALVDEESLLRPADRGLVLDLMGRVVVGQRWGVPAGAGTAGSRTWVKNGWDTVGDHDGRWLVNSIGRIVEDDHDWLVAVLSDHHGSLDAGIAAVEQAVRIAFDTWRRPAPSG
ncbi:serine hydrolase [Solwaraspora sp. WMMA2065]|uniref:serine hydrolase n=1 Tax=Solwaraspora sp. WMMA2065 TaxID=3015166 RepID=UPI00259BD649|nr:serine hydrolase [Solwaraspora sp. WMMA2065]WJK35877.1 serine hydrolase [Solwaraspora sp. WMMA2065]